MSEDQFRAAFIGLTGNEGGHFPWQWALYQLFAAGEFPPSCNLPTGLGKTSVIHIWLLALAHAPTLVPRRFARLQRKYGRWGLAYLESLPRAADWAASANPSAV
jgi:hypothetical protein